jgi:hypothetical protein
MDEGEGVCDDRRGLASPVRTRVGVDTRAVASEVPRVVRDEAAFTGVLNSPDSRVERSSHPASLYRYCSDMTEDATGL